MQQRCICIVFEKDCSYVLICLFSSLFLRRIGSELLIVADLTSLGSCLILIELIITSSLFIWFHHRSRRVFDKDLNFYISATLPSMHEYRNIISTCLSSRSFETQTRKLEVIHTVRFGLNFQENILLLTGPERLRDWGAGGGCFIVPHVFDKQNCMGCQISIAFFLYNGHHCSCSCLFSL